MTPAAALAAAGLLGLTSSVHCAAMCGPLAAVGCARKGRLEGGTLAGYVGGRVFGYALAGSAAGLVGAPLAAGRFGQGLRVAVAVAVAAFLVARAVSWARGGDGQLVRLRRGPSAFERLVPYLPRRGAALGFATTFFPCGVLLTALLSAAASGGAPLGASMMATFALASTPLLLLPTFVGARVKPLLARPFGRRLGAAGLVVLAAWVLVPPVTALSAPKKAETATCCGPKPAP